MKTKLRTIGRCLVGFPVIVTILLVPTSRVLSRDDLPNPSTAKSKENLQEPISWAAKPAWPNDRLPKHVTASQGVLTLFADYDDKHDDAIALYIVNRTDHAIWLPCYDRIPEIMLQRQLPDGRWERVQPHSSGFFCGNAIHEIHLPADHFIRFLGRHPLTGDPAVVRYASEDALGLMSNAGAGLVNEKMVNAARTDQMAQRRVLRSFVNVLRDPKDDPFGLAKPVPPSRIVAALELLRGFDQAWWFRHEVEKWVQSNQQSTDPEVMRASTAIGRLLKQKWPCFEDYPALFERCGSAVTNPGNSHPYGSPENERPLVWAILTDLASRPSMAKFYGLPPPKPFPKERIEQVADEAVRVALHGPDDEREEVGWLLLNKSFRPAVLPELLWENLFLNPSRRVWQPAAQVLLDQNKREKLFELALRHDAKTQISIIGTTTPWPDRSKPLAPLEMGALELHFWEMLWDRDPMGAIRTLAGVCGYDGIRPAPMAFRRRILDYLDQEPRKIETLTVKSTQGDVERTMREALGILDAWKLPDDTSVLQKYLASPWYVESTSNLYDAKENRYKNVTERRFLVRQKAKVLIEKRGFKVADDVVLEESF